MPGTVPSLSVHLSVLLSSFLRFAGYFDVPNLIEGIRRTDLLTSSLLIAVLFDVPAGAKNVQPVLQHSLCRRSLSFQMACNRADCPILSERTEYLENTSFKQTPLRIELNRKFEIQLSHR